MGDHISMSISVDETLNRGPRGYNYKYKFLTGINMILEIFKAYHGLVESINQSVSLGAKQIWPQYGYTLWLIDCDFVYWRYPATLLILLVDVRTSRERKFNIHVYDTALQPIYPRDIILTSLVLVHADYLLCTWHSLNTNYYGTTLGWMPGF